MYQHDHQNLFQSPTLTIYKHFDNLISTETVDQYSSVPHPILIEKKSLKADEEVKEYLTSLSFNEQFKRDCQSILAFLAGRDETDATYAKKQNILRRILIAIDNSELIYVCTKNKPIKTDINIPLAAILLHGATFKFTLPCLQSDDDPNDFFYALIDGKENIASYDENYHNGEQAAKENKPIFYRLPSHSAMNKLSLLTLKEHQYYGMNLGLGEKNQPLPANGQNGHLYMHWTPPSENKEGHLVIRIQSAEPNKKNRFGEFSASGGQHFSKSEIYNEIEQFHTDLTEQQITVLTHYFNSSSANNLLYIDNKLKTQVLNIHFVKLEKISDKTLEHFSSEVNIYHDKIHSIINENILNKNEIDVLSDHILHCKEIRKQLRKYGQSEALNDLNEKLNNLINIHAKIADYEIECYKDNDETVTKILRSSYPSNDKIISITQEIKITHRSLTSEIKNFEELDEIQNTLFTLNEAIKWVEEAINSYYQHNNHHEYRITLEHHDYLDNNFISNIIHYCRLKNYTLTSIPPFSFDFNQQDKNDFNQFYQQYECAFYQADNDNIKKANEIQANTLPTLTLTY